MLLKWRTEKKRVLAYFTYKKTNKKRKKSKLPTAAECGKKINLKN
jgi:hypothetical protein